MAASNTTIIDPALLPPSRRAAYFHSVYLQVSIWRQLNEGVFDPVEWGWKHYQGLLMPTTTDQPAAPENVLKFVRYNCKMTSRNTCGTQLCSCQRNGLKCVVACGDCRGEGCNNVETIEIEIDNELIDTD